MPVPQGLFRPRFDLMAWEAREEGDTSDQSSYWGEGLTPEEIEELTKPNPQEPTELEQLRTENMGLKLALAEVAEAQEIDKREMQLAISELAEIVAGGESIG
ncbi:hypothetical protein D3C74_284500 [compost metagenome]